MARVGSLTAQSLDPGRAFDWIFLVELLVCGILTLFFLFYFNRLFGTLISYGIRAYTWHKFRVYVDVQALQISLLGGRVFFKGVRYHGENETILIQHGYITWNYWLRAVRHADCHKSPLSGSYHSASLGEDAGGSYQSQARQSEGEAGGLKAGQDLPSRISVSVTGFEWFIYNRSPAYDAIRASQAIHHTPNVTEPGNGATTRSAADDDTGQREYSEADDFDDRPLSQPLTRPSTTSTSETYSVPAATDNGLESKDSRRGKALGNRTGSSPLETRARSSSTREAPPNASVTASPLILTLLPISIECQKGAIVIGNEHTRAILSTKFERTKGLIDATASTSRDVYRQLFEFDITRPIVQMKPNPDYRHSQQGAAQSAIDNAISTRPRPNWFRFHWQFSHRKRKLMRNLRNLVPYFRSSVESFHSSSLDEKTHVLKGNWPGEVPGGSKWLGLSRYLDDNDRDDHEGWSDVEYARFSNVLDCPGLHINLYWDVPGLVSRGRSANVSSVAQCDINLADPPAYGLDVIVRGGNINYGPWADRVRADIQSVFFPSSYQDALPAAELPVGTLRQSTIFSIDIHLENETTLRIPTRENSKDKQWKGRSGALWRAAEMKQQGEKKFGRRRKDEKNLPGPDVRPFGWFEVSLSSNSTITYNMDMVARKKGFHNNLELNLKGTRMTTSVNHALLWTCGPQKISCDLSNPPEWNALHSWTFDVQNRDMELFLLRDHVFLLTDMINDFTSGPAGDFLMFVPFCYRLKLSFAGVKLLLNANDSNIIDKAVDLDENTFLMLHGETLEVNVDIPLEDYRPFQNKVHFRAKARNARLDVTKPIWNTGHTFASAMPTATIKDFSMDGSYSYYSDTSPGLTDSLFLNLNGFSPRIYLHGTLIRYCMKLKDNYFGDDIHFRTLEEYQEMLSREQEVKPEPAQHLSNKDNDLDVVLNVSFHRVCALLPGNLYSRKENLRLDFLLVEADVRFTNYYMDIQAEFSPIEAAWESVAAEEVGIQDQVSGPQAFVDGITIYGHRLFGSAPAEPTYVCNWDFDIGEVTGECSTLFVRILLQAIRSFAFTFSDDENTLPQSHVPVIHDVTFLRAKVGKVNICLVLDEIALFLGVREMRVMFNDWAGKSYSERLHLEMPGIELAAVDYKTAIRHKDRLDHPIPSHAVLQLSLLLRMTETKRGLVEERQLQQRHISFHDQRTRRVTWLLHDSSKTDQPRERLDRLGPAPPAMPIPHMPAPLSGLLLDSFTGRRSSTRLRKDQSDAKRRRQGSSLSRSSSMKKPSLRPAEKPSISGRKLPPRQAYQKPSCAPPNDLSENKKQSVQQPDLTDRHPGHTGGSQDLGATAKFASPWSAPIFRLQNITLDTKDLPEKPVSNSNDKSDPESHHDVREIYSHLEIDDAISHTMFDLDLTSGVRAFATPAFFSAIAVLLKALQPTQPTDLLDDLQIRTMSELLKLAKIRSDTGQRTDFCIRLPFAHLRMIDLGSRGMIPPIDAYRDQYDLQLFKAQLTARSSTDINHGKDSKPVGNDLYFHFAVQRGLFEVHDRSVNVIYNEAAAKISLEDIVLWISSTDRVVAKFQQRHLEVTSWRSRIEYLKSLIYRTGDMAKSIMSQINHLDSFHRLQSLVYLLTEEASGSSDPIFLTRPSYVLRTAGQHLRLHDSWKIASRLRYMLHSLDRDQRATLIDQVHSLESPVPSNAEALVLASFDNWRSWDLAHVRKTVIMEHIWLRATVDNHSQQQRPNMILELNLENTRFSLDPGPQENHLLIHDIMIAISMSNMKNNALGRKSGGLAGSRTVMIQTYCSQFGMNLNWEMVDLISDMMQSLSESEIGGQASVSPVQQHRQPATNLQLHLVIGVESGTVTLDGINITLVVAVSGLRGSAVHQTTIGGPDTQAALLTATSASARIKDGEKVVLGCLLDRSTLCFSQISPLSGKTNAVVAKVTGRCEALRLDMTEYMGNVFDIANRVLRDEVGILHKLGARPGSMSPSAQEGKHSARKQRHDIYLAFSLDQYSLSIDILPVLTYVISGNVARTSTFPRTSSLVINSDLNGHSHAFRPKDGNQRTQIAELDLPPLSGRMIISRSTSSTRVDLNAIVDKVKLDATSVRACIDLVNKPEAIHALINAKDGAQQLSSRFKNTFPPALDGATQPSQASVPLNYAANVALIGLAVHASAPGLKSSEYRADLDFVLGLTTIRLDNESAGRRPVHERPQFDISLRQVGVYIHQRSHRGVIKYGSLDFRAQMTGRTETDDNDKQVQMYHATSDQFAVSLHPQTASLVVDIAAHLQERVKSFTLPDQVKRLKPLRRLNIAGLTDAPTITVTTDDGIAEDETISSNIFDSVYSLELNAIRFAWMLDAETAKTSSRQVENLVFSIERVNLNTKRGGSATLSISDLRLQMAPSSLEAEKRSLNSALMPEVVFKTAYLSTKKDRRFALQAAGKALDLRLTSDFILPATALRDSLAAASAELREGSALWAAQPISSKKEKSSLFSSKYLASLLIDADFAGAVVNVHARKSEAERKSVFGMLKGDKRSRAGRYNQAVHGDGATQAILRAPGVAMKIEYTDNGQDDPALNAEIKVAASSNVLYPSVVPLIIEISSSIQEMVGMSSEGTKSTPERKTETEKQQLTNTSLASNNPANLMGRCKLNLGLWISEQMFTLSCQPIARVAATARCSDIFLAVNTVQSAEQERFFALSIDITNLQASVQHVYSRESTASFEVESIVLSMMNSKHISNTTGVSAILNIRPMKASINAKQMQDFLLFRDIWYPTELRQASGNPSATSATAENQAIVVQRYQQVATVGAFPWNAVVSIQQLTAQVDLGQSLGKSVFTISQLWASSKKASDYEQNLCLGLGTVGIESTGRMSGFVELQNFRIRTSIRWPRTALATGQAPRVQASLSVDHCRLKAAFDYQPFAVAEISNFEFLMYNVRSSRSGGKDRLVGNLEGEKVQVFLTTASASQALALYQAVIRLIQEKEVAYEASLQELDRHLRRKSIFPSSTWTAASTELGGRKDDIVQGPFSLHTDVVVSLRAVNIGAFPSTFFDNQIFKVEATDAQARFAVSAKDGQTHSRLGLTLGQLRVALSSVSRANTQALGEVSVTDVVNRATSSRGGTILKVPKVVAVMQTWQRPSSKSIDYMFRSAFEGKVDVGWNYSRISFIRGMWATHSKALAARLGKPLAPSAVQITGGPLPDDDQGDGKGQEKITAVVNVPQSRFEYHALEPPIIETPQLRDMGEATPPLEWIGLHRGKLPNLTHQIIIVTLLEVAKEVEDAYSKILGSS